jgi:uncharacterized membrane protein YeiH
VRRCVVDHFKRFTVVGILLMALLLVTSFSLVLYAIVGAQKGVNSGLPVLGCVLLAAVTATAGRFYVDLSSGVTPKHFVRGEWFVSVAVLTGVVWIALFALGLNTWIRAGVALATGYAVRVLAMYRGWAEPSPRGPQGLRARGPARSSP